MHIYVASRRGVMVDSGDEQDKTGWTRCRHVRELGSVPGGNGGSWFSDAYICSKEYARGRWFTICGVYHQSEASSTTECAMKENPCHIVVCAKCLHVKPSHM